MSLLKRFMAVFCIVTAIHPTPYAVAAPFSAKTIEQKVQELRVAITEVETVEKQLAGAKRTKQTYRTTAMVGITFSAAMAVIAVVSAKFARIGPPDYRDRFRGAARYHGHSTWMIGAAPAYAGYIYLTDDQVRNIEEELRIAKAQRLGALEALEFAVAQTNSK